MKGHDNVCSLKTLCVKAMWAGALARSPCTTNSRSGPIANAMALRPSPVVPVSSRHVLNDLASEAMCFRKSVCWKCPKGTLRKGTLRIYLNFTCISWFPRLLLEFYLNFTRRLLEFYWNLNNLFEFSFPRSALWVLPSVPHLVDESEQSTFLTVEVTTFPVGGKEQVSCSGCTHVAERCLVWHFKYQLFFEQLY